MILRVIEILAYYCGVDALFYFINRKSKRIITFHNVLPDELFEKYHVAGVVNSFSSLKQIVGEVSKRYRFSTDILDVNTATITFDDGYKNQTEIAGRYLNSIGVPAILFVSGAIIDSNADGALLVDKLLHYVEYASKHILERLFGEFGSRKQLWQERIWPEFNLYAEGKGSGLIDQLIRQMPFDAIVSQLPEEYVRLRLNGVSSSDLDELRAQGWIVGWHTYSHLPLSRLSYSDLTRELNSPEEYKDVVISYPYGETSSVDMLSLLCAKEMGYPCAVSNSVAHVVPEMSRYFLPRVSLSADKYSLHFELSGFKHFLRYREFLPGVNGLLSHLRKLFRMLRNRISEARRVYIYYASRKRDDLFVDPRYVECRNWRSFVEFARSKNFPLTYWQYERFMQDESAVFVALSTATDVLSYGWTSQNNRSLLLGHEYQGRILYDFFTPPIFRGNGYYTRLLISLLANGGGVIYVDRRNVRSLAAICKAGFKEV